MIGYVEKIGDVEDSAQNEHITVSSDSVMVDESDDLASESPVSLNRKIKKNCDSRKKLEEKLEQARVKRQVEDYNFDDLDE